MDDTDIALLRRCAALADEANKVATAFSVGAILADSNRRVLAAGFSRELGPAWHAEAVVIEKARKAGTLEQARILYSSLEPCSLRKSGRQPCCQVILTCPIEKVVFIAPEPAVFVMGAGSETLAQAGLEIEICEALTPLVQSANAHLWPADIAPKDGAIN